MCRCKQTPHLTVKNREENKNNEKLNGALLVPFHAFVLALFRSGLFCCLSRFVRVHKGSGSYFRFCPRPCFEHVPMGQARNPPTQRSTLSAQRVLSCPLWPCCYCMGVIAERLGSLHRLAHAAEHCHFGGASTQRAFSCRTLDRKMANISSFTELVAMSASQHVVYAPTCVCTCVVDHSKGKHVGKKGTARES